MSHSQRCKLLSNKKKLLFLTLKQELVPYNKFKEPFFLFREVNFTEKE